MFDKPYLLLGTVVAFVLLASGVAVQTARLNTAKATLDTCNLKVDGLRQAIETQNAAVRKLVAASDQAAERAKALRDELERTAAERDANATKLRQWKRNTGEGECTAATRLLQEYAR